MNVVLVAEAEKHHTDPGPNLTAQRCKHLSDGITEEMPGKHFFGHAPGIVRFPGQGSNQHQKACGLYITKMWQQGSQLSTCLQTGSLFF